MIRKVESILKKNKLPFKKLSDEDQLPRFPIRYTEGFDIDEGRILIRFQNVLDDVTILEIGPIQEGKEIETLGIDVLREKIDAVVGRVD